jgi:hypothetical protein
MSARIAPSWRLGIKIMLSHFGIKELVIGIQTLVIVFLVALLLSEQLRRPKRRPQRRLDTGGTQSKSPIEW